MLMEFIAAIALGFAAAGVIMTLRWLSGGRVPKALIPVAAGLGMFGFAIWSEYSWFARHSSALPERMVVVTSVRESSSWRPWTWALPFVTRFAAVDTAGVKRNDKLPGLVMANVYLFARRQPPARLPHIIDCPGLRRAELAGDVRFDADGLPQDLHWLPLSADQPLFRALCTGAKATARGAASPWPSSS